MKDLTEWYKKLLGDKIEKMVHPTPYTLHSTPYTLHPTPYTRHPAPCIIHPESFTLNPQHAPWLPTPNPQPSSSLLPSSLESSDTQVYEPSTRALLGTASHFSEVVILKLRRVAQVISNRLTTSPMAIGEPRPNPALTLLYVPSSLNIGNPGP